MPKPPESLLEERARKNDCTTILPHFLPTAQQKNTSSQSVPPCPGCGSHCVNLVQMPAYVVHYAAQRCADCDTFRGWESKPETEVKRSQTRATISQLLKCKELSDWERRFLESVGSRKKLSPRQTEILNNIANKPEGKN